MRLAIADPPYLGRGRRWYGDGRGHAGGRGRPDRHDEAAHWDDPASHRELVARLERDYDGWAIAASADSLGLYLGCAPDARVLIWHRGNAIPSGARVANQWEPVIARIPPGRTGRAGGPAASDVLTAGISTKQGFVGAKPTPWTQWVLDVLGYDPEVDELHDLFTGSGAVATAAIGYQPPPEHRCAACGARITQGTAGRPRKTCSDACRQHLARRTAARRAHSLRTRR